MFLKIVITSTVALSMLAVSVLNTTTAVSADTVSDTQNAINTNKSETDKLLKDIASANADNIKLQEQISLHPPNTARIPMPSSLQSTFDFFSSSCAILRVMSP